MERFRRRHALVAAFAAVLVAGMLAAPALAAIKPPAGAAKPTPGSGIGTTAALENPRCNTEEERYGVYGRFSSTAVAGGPICVKPWDDGDDNGGATAPGVTKDKITVVAVVPNSSQVEGTNAAQGTAPVKRADMSQGTYEDAIHDYFLPLMSYFETWGRDLDVKFVTSSGFDEAAQRADAVTIKSLKPFAVMDFVSAGLDVLDREVASAKILVYGDANTTTKALAQAPYRWGLSDVQSAASNAAELVGKQLVGKKAEFAGDADIQNKPRKFAAVYIEDQLDIDQFKEEFAKYKGKLASANAYPASGTSFGDDVKSQEIAPVLVSRMKDAGITTVIMFSDIAMNKAMMAQATEQEWSPEWYFTGALFSDLALFARNYDQDQTAHAFGVSTLSPFVTPDPVPPPPEKSLSVLLNPLNWYWGEGVGTQVPNVVPRGIGWLLNGVHTAGPQLTVKNFQRGLFSVPATGGAASGYTVGSLTGFGRTPGLPYDEYNTLGLDFAPIWWDSDTTGLSNATGPIEGKGVVRYVDGAKRYKASTWPKKQFAWFETEGTVIHFDTRQTPTPVYAGDCEGCPATGGAGSPGTPSSSGFVVPAGGGGSSSA